MQNSTFIANVTTKLFKKGGEPTTEDTNGNLPLQLNVIAGKCPSRAIVMNGTVAQGSGVEAGKTYVFMVNLRDTNEYGANYTHTVLGTLNPSDLIQLPQYIKSYGQPKIVSEDDNTEVEVGQPREKAVADFN